MDVSPECLCRAVTWGSWSQCFGIISLERGLGKGKGTTHSCVMKRAQVGSCPQDLSSVQVSGFNPSYWMALGSSSWVLYFCSWKQSSEASGTLCGLSTGSYTEARISDEINGNPWFGLGQQFIRKQKRVVENSCSSWSATVTFFQLQRKACYQKNKGGHYQKAPAPQGCPSPSEQAASTWILCPCLLSLWLCSAMCLLKGRHKSAHENLLPALVHGCHFRLVQLVREMLRQRQRGINEGSSAHGPSMGVITWQ